MRWPLLVSLSLVPMMLTPDHATAQTSPETQPVHRAAWMRRGHWGVMSHYLADWIARRENLPDHRMTVDQWNEAIDRFDVEALADQINATGAAWYILTIGQNSGFYCSPNATYDRIVGTSPSHCSRRDLISDLADALAKRNVRLVVYLPSGAPNGDAIAKEKLQWQNGAHPNREFQQHWEAIVREWSLRWRTKVSGWWFDGCYWPNTMYRGDDLPNFKSFAAAVRAGNPDSAIAFNPGVVYRTMSITPYEDYTAGEVDQPEKWMLRRAADGYADGAQIHMLSFLGTRWGTGEKPRFSDDDAIRFSRMLFDAGGAISWDVPIQRNGTISQPFIDQLNVIGKSMRELAATRPASSQP